MLKSGEEKYSRGWRGAPAKGVGRETGARVQIPPSPPRKQVSKDACFFDEKNKELNPSAGDRRGLRFGAPRSGWSEKGLAQRSKKSRKRVGEPRRFFREPQEGLQSNFKSLLLRYEKSHFCLLTKVTFFNDIRSWRNGRYIFDMISLCERRYTLRHMKERILYHIFNENISYGNVVYHIAITIYHWKSHHIMI